MKDFNDFTTALEKVIDSSFELSDIWDDIADEKKNLCMEAYPLPIPWNEFAWLLSRWRGSIFDKEAENED